MAVGIPGRGPSPGPGSPGGLAWAAPASRTGKKKPPSEPPGPQRYVAAACTVRNSGRVGCTRRTSLRETVCLWLATRRPWKPWLSRRTGPNRYAFWIFCFLPFCSSFRTWLTKERLCVRSLGSRAGGGKGSGALFLGALTGRRGALDGGPRGCEVCTQHAVGRAHPSLRSGHRNDVCEFVTRTRGRPAPGGLPAAWALGGGFPQRPQVPKAD